MSFDIGMMASSVFYDAKDYFSENTSKTSTKFIKGKHQILQVQIKKSLFGTPAKIPIFILREKGKLLGLINSAVQQKRSEGYSNLWFSI